MQLTEGLHIADRFRLVRLLGQGGMGSVWLADHLALEIPCAIKFIDKEQNSPEARKRFEREAKAAAQLRGQHVVQILDHGIWENVPYIAMEYLEGEDLAVRLDRVVRLPNAQTVRIIAQVCKGLARAHAAGIVHRDMKPENIFLTRDGDDEVVKVLDFGIAKRSQTSLSEAGTKTGSLLGTPFFMSPEQARGVKGIDHRSDLFSLGIIAYQCVTGQLPFYSEGLGDVLAKIMYEPIPNPSDHAHVPPGFDAWWRRAAARPVEERFQSAKELADSLALALGVTSTIDVPALAPRPTEPSSVDLANDRLPSANRFAPRGPLAPTQLAAPPEIVSPAERAAEPSSPRTDHRTIDHPLTRTFDPAPAPAGWRKKAAIGGGAVIALVVIVFVSFAGRASSTGPVEATIAAARPPEPTLAVGGEVRPNGSLEVARGVNAELPAKPGEPALVPGEMAAPKDSAHAPPAPAVPAKRKIKPAKGPTGTPGKRDYGI